MKRGSGFKDYSGKLIQHLSKKQEKMELSFIWGVVLLSVVGLFGYLIISKPATTGLTVWQSNISSLSYVSMWLVLVVIVVGSAVILGYHVRKD